jgi:TonB family protein
MLKQLADLYSSDGKDREAALVRDQLREEKPGVQADPEGLELVGSADRDSVRSVIRAHRPQIAQCYQAALTRRPTLAGKVTVKFVISSKGSVVSAGVVESTVQDEGMESCLVAEVKRWRMPEPKGGGVVVVKYPFFFKADSHSP